ncbi:glycoside hydrolase family 3 C-terminal domain-containing protein [Streptomyces afghaniensis]|uniref:glycoside hydrolase family 3 C-terminal domain-containing protein n=1 Tax=Streptomyces afghaniensis TaxID=66865 RepID=UPI00277F33C7|nr:glycoside hydrolase family 3 C-terminal domain-containing protein [Streptomyces afghaniensis]MDQ1022259.1 hypothetical protein [Streptomyces afghaniensis]
MLKHFLAYNSEDDRCVTSSGVRPRVLREYDLAAFRPAVADGAATGAMAAYNLVNGRPCHVSPLIETELRRWAEPTGHELFVVSDEEAPSNLVDLEHYFDDHAAGYAAALKAGIDSFTDQKQDSTTVISRLREALDRGLIDESDIDRAARRHLSLRFRLGEFDPDLDPYASIGPEVIDSPEHRALALRAATESVVLLKNEGLLPLSPRNAPRVAVIGPLADTLCEDWYSGTLPYGVTVVAGLRAALAEHGGEVVCVEGADRIGLRSRTNGRLLCGVSFDVAYWGGDALTLRDADTGRYLSLKDDGSLAADQEQIKSWFVHETFFLEPVPGDDPDTVLLRSRLTGRYAAIDPADGRVTVTAESPETAEHWRRELVRDGLAGARAAAEQADIAVVVLGNHPLINGRETEDRADTALPTTQKELLRTRGAVRAQRERRSEAGTRFGQLHVRRPHLPACLRVLLIHLLKPYRRLAQSPGRLQVQSGVDLVRLLRTGRRRSRRRLHMRHRRDLSFDPAEVDPQPVAVPHPLQPLPEPPLGRTGVFARQPRDPRWGGGAVLDRVALRVQAVQPVPRADDLVDGASASVRNLFQHLLLGQRPQQCAGPLVVDLPAVAVHGGDDAGRVPFSVLADHPALQHLHLGQPCLSAWPAVPFQ